MDNRERDRVTEAIELLRNGMIGAEEKKPDYPTAYGYLTGAVEFVAKQLEKLLPVTHPTCAVGIGWSDITYSEIACGEKIVDRRCPEHGDVTA